MMKCVDGKKLSEEVGEREAVVLLETWKIFLKVHDEEVLEYFEVDHDSCVMLLFLGCFVTAHSMLQ